MAFFKFPCLTLLKLFSLRAKLEIMVTMGPTHGHQCHFRGKPFHLTIPQGSSAQWDQGVFSPQLPPTEVSTLEKGQGQEISPDPAMSQTWPELGPCGIHHSFPGAPLGEFYAQLRTTCWWFPSPKEVKLSSIRVMAEKAPTWWKSLYVIFAPFVTLCSSAGSVR